MGSGYQWPAGKKGAGKVSVRWDLGSRSWEEKPAIAHRLPWPQPQEEKIMNNVQNSRSKTAVAVSHCLTLQRCPAVQKKDVKSGFHDTPGQDQR